MKRNRVLIHGLRVHIELFFRGHASLEKPFDELYRRLARFHGYIRRYSARFVAYFYLVGELGIFIAGFSLHRLAVEYNRPSVDRELVWQPGEFLLDSFRLPIVTLNTFPIGPTHNQR